jgi:hypothetical protein
MKPKRLKSQLRHPAARNTVDFEARLKLGRHKHDSDWSKKLQTASKRWLQAGHDSLILAMSAKVDGKLFSQEEVETAIQWECFRHLYFTGKLSARWKRFIEEDRFRVLEQFRSSMKASFLSHDRLGFAAPWNMWADDPCFPVLAWSEARDKAEFLFGLSIAKKQIAARLIPADLSQGGLFARKVEEIRDNQFALSEKGDIQGLYLSTLKPLEVKHSTADNLTSLVVEIDWTTTKEEIEAAFAECIKPIWDARNPGGSNGRGDSDLMFFKGLVLRRRLDRGLLDHDACKDLYTPLLDRKDGMPHAAKNALRFAESRLAQTKSALEQVEAKLTES